MYYHVDPLENFKTFPLSPKDCSAKLRGSGCSAGNATKTSPPEPEGPKLSRLWATFVQPGNSMGTTEDFETLDLKLEFQLDEDDGCFYTLHTDGWSFDSIDEIERLIQRCLNVLRY